MSLRKSPSRTPAFMAAQRANAKKSTGPRTRDGKGLAKLNALKNGRHSRVWKRFTDFLVQAPADLDLVSES